MCSVCVVARVSRLANGIRDGKSKDWGNEWLSAREMDEESVCFDASSGLGGVGITAFCVGQRLKD